MENKKRLIVSLVILIIAVALFIVGMIILPETIVMQVQADGSVATTLPKLIGLLIPLALSGIFAFLYYKNGTTKSLIVALIGLAAFGLTFFFNR
jgi:uncharacterized membrane protein